MSELSKSYNPLEQFQIYNIYLYREGWKEEDKFDIKEMMFEFLIYEDMFDPSMSASITLNDFTNLPDNFPLVGGERIDITFKTPTKDDKQTLEFVVSKISKIHRQMNNKQFQLEVLELITPDRYYDLNYDLSMAFSGTYSEIVKGILSKLGTTKKVTVDESLYLQTFISPQWSPIKCCKEIAKRTIGSKFEPFLFYENMDGYQFKSIKTIYGQQPYITLRIEPGRVNHDIADTDTDRKRYRVLKYEYGEFSNRARQDNDNAFGSYSKILDPITKRFAEQTADYSVMAQSKDFAKMEDFPVYDSMTSKRKVEELVMTKTDKSHEGHYYRKMALGLIDNYRLKVMVAGDSQYRVGQIINLDLPDKSVSEYIKEQTTSGRWLIASLKHMIQRESYSTVLELVKDSHSVDITKRIKGKPEYDNTRAPTGSKSTEPADKPTDRA